MEHTTQKTHGPSAGERKIGTTFVSGNNSQEQNTQEAFAHLYNRIEKFRHGGENIEDQQELNDLNESINRAHELLIECFLMTEKAEKYNQE